MVLFVIFGRWNTGEGSLVSLFDDHPHPLFQMATVLPAARFNVVAIASVCISVFVTNSARRRDLESCLKICGRENPAAILHGCFDDEVDRK